MQAGQGLGTRLMYISTDNMNCGRGKLLASCYQYVCLMWISSLCRVAVGGELQLQEQISCSIKAFDLIFHSLSLYFRSGCYLRMVVLAPRVTADSAKTAKLATAIQMWEFTRVPMFGRCNSLHESYRHKYLFF